MSGDVGNGLQSAQETGENVVLFRVWKKTSTLYHTRSSRLKLLLLLIGQALAGLALVALCCLIFSSSGEPWPRLRWLLFYLLATIIYVTVRTVSTLSDVVEERLMFFRDIGVMRIAVTAGGCETKDFFEATQIESILINEGISCWSVLFYLIILLKKREKKPVVLAFQHLRPSLAFLRTIKAESHRILSIKRAHR